jgi:type IV pilus assembly protein PilB
LKFNVSREPQDGRFTMKTPSGKDIEIRVSILPSEFGETTVLRVLYTAAIELDLSQLGFRADDLAVIDAELQRPDGMILNTGPTGSGKTTTLYTFLRRKRTPEMKIVTIEHPIEYHLEGIAQTQVDEKSGYDFATALKSVLRQDPDVILVGEINDRDTAEVGMEAALTGHLVFSTVHANSAPAAIPRLLDLGISLGTIGPAVNLIIAQRLVRRLCVSCRRLSPADGELEKKIDVFLRQLPTRVVRPSTADIALYQAQGCSVCNGFGYKGRIGIFELFRVDDAVESSLQLDASLAGITAFAFAHGMVPLQHDGILKVLRGETTFDELISATGPLTF